MQRLHGTVSLFEILSGKKGIGLYDSSKASHWLGESSEPFNSFGTFKFSNNNLVLDDQAGIRVWGTNFMGVVGSSLVKELLDDGNFVIKNTWDNDTAGFLWQSFDFLTDTLLPGMALGWKFHRGINRYLLPFPDGYLLPKMALGWNFHWGVNQYLVAWETPDNPSKSSYTLNLEPKR
ncbi:putative non-specific serine/threonine protein kinase [Arabidopsis thaliana]